MCVSLLSLIPLITHGSPLSGRMQPRQKRPLHPVPVSSAQRDMRLPEVCAALTCCCCSHRLSTAWSLEVRAAILGEAQHTLQRLSPHHSSTTSSATMRGFAVRFLRLAVALALAIALALALTLCRGRASSGRRLLASVAASRHPPRDPRSGSSMLAPMGR